MDENEKMADEEVCGGKKSISNLTQQMLSNTRTKIPVLIDRCNSTRNSTSKESGTCGK